MAVSERIASELKHHPAFVRSRTCHTDRVGADPESTIVRQGLMTVIAMTMFLTLLQLCLALSDRRSPPHEVDNLSDLWKKPVVLYGFSSFAAILFYHVVVNIHNGRYYMNFSEWLGVLEYLATNLLVSSSSLTGFIDTLTTKQEHIGTTFWFDVPHWVQVSGLCPNLQCSQSPLQYKAMVIASTSDHAAVTQAQQTTDPPIAQNIQSPPMQGSSNLPGASSPSAVLTPGSIALNQVSQPSSSPQQSLPSELHVFMTSKVGGHYLLSQWNTLTPHPQDDRKFFSKLRECYISARGFWRYQLGFKVFSHCEFYRVSGRNLKIRISSDLMHSSKNMDHLPLASRQKSYPSAVTVQTSYNHVLNIWIITTSQSQQRAIRRSILKSFTCISTLAIIREQLTHFDGIDADTCPHAQMKLCV